MGHRRWAVMADERAGPEPAEKGGALAAAALARRGRSEEPPIR
jgi:hypothetical protein